jgi:hypothetical protein
MFSEIEFGRMYAELPQTEREALDETIHDQGVSDLKSLIAAIRMVETYFKEQPSPKLTFKEFQATKRAVTWDKAKCQEMGQEEETLEVLEYADGNSYIVCLPDGMYELVIANEDWYDARLEMLEQLLYDRWYS